MKQIIYGDEETLLKKAILKPVLIGAAVLVAASSSAPAHAVSAPGYHLVRRISLPGVEGWDYLTLDSSARRLYIARSSRVTVVNIDTGKAIGDITGLNGCHGIALDVKRGRGYISDGRANSVLVFDLKSLRTINTIAVGEGPDAILFEPVTQRVFTFNGRAHSATAIDAATEKVVGTVALPGRPEFPVADGRGHLFDNLEDKSEVADVDARALTVSHVWSIAPGEGPSGITMDTQRRRVFSVCGNQKMTVLDADTGHVVAAPAIGNGPDATRFDPDTRLVFSPNGEDGTLTILREDKPDVYTTLETISTQTGARTLALDEKTHHVFTVTADRAPSAPGTAEPHWSRHYVPNTFVVLEYAPR